jgi:hypothetical protein
MRRASDRRDAVRRYRRCAAASVAPMSASSLRSTRSPASPRKAPRLRSPRGDAAAAGPSAASGYSADLASTGDMSDACGVELPAALELKETTRSMATRSTRPPERDRPLEHDRFLESFGALWDWIKYVGRDATWRVALASIFGCVSTQIPLPNDTAFARALLFVGAVTFGALMGKRLERKRRRKR